MLFTRCFLILVWAAGGVSRFALAQTLPPSARLSGTGRQ